MKARVVSQNYFRKNVITFSLKYAKIQISLNDTK